MSKQSSTSYCPSATSVPETPEISIAQNHQNGRKNTHRQPKPPSPETVRNLRTLAAKFERSSVATPAAIGRVRHMLAHFDDNNRPVDVAARLSDVHRQIDETRRVHAERMQHARARVVQLKAEIEAERRSNSGPKQRTQPYSSDIVSIPRTDDDPADLSTSFIETVPRSGPPAGTPPQITQPSKTLDRGQSIGAPRSSTIESIHRSAGASAVLSLINNNGAMDNEQRLQSPRAATKLRRALQSSRTVQVTRTASSSVVVTHPTTEGDHQNVACSRTIHRRTSRDVFLQSEVRTTTKKVNRVRDAAGPSTAAVASGGESAALVTTTAAVPTTTAAVAPMRSNDESIFSRPSLHPLYLRRNVVRKMY